MNKIDITFLGTGSVTPTPSRGHPAILLSHNKENILIDCGEGTQTQFRKAKISPQKLTRILITHWHGDHTFGLPGLLKTLDLNEYKKTLEIYGPKGTKTNMALLNKLAKTNFPIKIHEVSSGKIIKTPEFTVSCISMKHSTPCLAYSFETPAKLRLDKKKIKKLKLPHSPLLKKLSEGKSIKHLGKTIKASQVTYKEPGKKVTFILDTAENPNTIKISKASDLLICESTFSILEEKQAKEKSHLTSKQAANIAKKSKVKELILTHLSQIYQKDLSIIENEAKSTFKNTSIAEDLQKISI
jgi:ribonuclease Z